MTAVLAIDPSLTATATCWAQAGNRPAIAMSRTKPAGRTSADKLDRMHRQVTFAAEYAAEASLVLIEGPSFSSKGSATRDLAGLWWLMFAELIRHPAPVAVVPPSALKKWATGVGNADKFRVGQAIGKRWPDIELHTDDEADALGLASMGLHHAGHLPWTPTAYQDDALSKIEWNQMPVKA